MTWKSLREGHTECTHFLYQHIDPQLPEMQDVFVNPLLLLFKTLLHGQKDCIFFSGYLNLRTTPETGLPSRKKKS